MRRVQEKANRLTTELETMPVTQKYSNKASTALQAGNPENAHKESNNKDETESHRRESPENCSICLGPFNNKSFTSSCAHSFCFVCLKQWSKVKAECPLCKQSFTSIFHNIRSDQSYDIYELPVLPPSRHNSFEFFFPSSLTTFSANTHPYLNFAQPSLDADLTLSNFSRFQFRHRRYDRFPHPVHGEHQYSFLFNPATHISAASWPRGAEDFRRAVYKHRLGPPLFILGNETSTYRLTPTMMAASAHRLQRIMPWLTRELKVLLKSHQSVRLAISIIQPLLTQVLIDSLQFSEKVSPLIGRKAQQFIQEFVAFANSALTVQAFDRKAIYFRQDTSSISLDDSSSRSGSDDDDVVEITDVSSDAEIIGRTSPVPGVSGLLRTGWDSPTPGPSWENLDVNSIRPPLEIETVSVSSEGDDPVFRPDLVNSDSSSKTGSDIVFLKYDKPWTERSPIQLSSDSDSEKKFKKRKTIHKRKRRNPSYIVYKSHEISKQKKSSEDEILTFQEASSALRKNRGIFTTEKLKRKKKKSRDVDQELVDRLVAKAISQKLNTSHPTASIDQDGGPCSSKGRENTGKSSLSEKGKNRHKKKFRKRSGDSQSSYNLHSYKKHHSGHKKSGERTGPESIKQKDISQGDNIPDCESSSWDTQLLRTQSLASQAVVEHSSYHQSNYIPDTLQHIPLNLWVSAWPTIPTTCTLSTAPPSSSLSLPNNSALDSCTLLSESSSDTDSDDTEHYSISSVKSSTRTKQWLEDNFPHPDVNGNSSESKKGISPSKLSTKEKQSQVILNTSENVGFILSVSDDEDVVVCNSSSSSSNRSELNIHIQKDVNKNVCGGLDILHIVSNSLDIQEKDTEIQSDTEHVPKMVGYQESFPSTEISSSSPFSVNDIKKATDEGFLSDRTKIQTHADRHLFECSNMNQVSEIQNNTHGTNLDLLQSSEKLSHCINIPVTSSNSLPCTSRLDVEYKPVSLPNLLLTFSPSSSLTSLSSMFPEPKIEPLNLSVHSATSLNTAVFPLFHSCSQPRSHVTPKETIRESETLNTFHDSIKGKNVMSLVVDRHNKKKLENLPNENSSELSTIKGLYPLENDQAISEVSSEQQKDANLEEFSIHLGNDTSPVANTTEQNKHFGENQNDS